MNTNDEQAGYGEPKREPMLSDSKAESILHEHNMDYRFSHRLVTSLISGFYENLITTGKLRVVEEVKNCNSAPGYFTCSRCGATIAHAYYSYPPHHSEHGGFISCCPGCGNKIKR